MFVITLACLASLMAYSFGVWDGFTVEVEFHLIVFQPLVDEWLAAGPQNCGVPHVGTNGI